MDNKWTLNIVCTHNREYTRAPRIHVLMKNPVAQELGRLGGKARAAKMDKNQRSKQAKLAAQARCAKLKAGKDDKAEDSFPFRVF